MIYKFIDNNGSEISVNSLESLQALIDSDTINENTKVKAGLRGKWTTASEIEGLNFIKEEEIQNIMDFNTKMVLVVVHVIEHNVFWEVLFMEGKELVIIVKI